MKIKIGDQWFTSQPGKPMMVVLSSQDKVNIAKMSEYMQRYAIFCEEDPIYDTLEKKISWMEQDYKEKKNDINITIMQIEDEKEPTH